MKYNGNGKSAMSGGPAPAEPVLTVSIDGDKLIVKSDMLDSREFYLPGSTFKTIELFLMYIAAGLGEALAKERPWRGGKP